jgi:hypothetical protein
MHHAEKATSIWTSSINELMIAASYQAGVGICHKSIHSDREKLTSRRVNSIEFNFDCLSVLSLMGNWEIAIHNSSTNIRSWTFLGISFHTNHS